MAYDRFLIDKRVVERNIAKGLVDQAEYKRIVEALPDRESNCVHVSLDGDSGASSAADDPSLDDLDDADDEDEGDDEGDED